MTSLPGGLDFDKRGAIRGQKYEREKNVLEILFHGNKMLIISPCPCRLNRRTMTQSARLSEINEWIAVTCVESAKSIARLLLNHFNVVRLYEAGLRWNVVHVIMQSLAVLLLGISYEANYSSPDGQDAQPSLKKVVRWLRALKSSSMVAQRVNDLATALLRGSIGKINMVSKSECQESHSEPQIDKYTSRKIV